MELGEALLVVGGFLVVSVGCLVAGFLMGFRYASSFLPKATKGIMGAVTSNLPKKWPELIGMALQNPEKVGTLLKGLGGGK
jgi:hypothetical protein